MYPPSLLYAASVPRWHRSSTGTPGHGQFLRCDLPEPARPQGRFVAGFDPDDAILIIPLAMVLGAGVPLLVAATVAAPIAALVFFFEVRRRRRAAEDEADGTGG